MNEDSQDMSEDTIAKKRPSLRDATVPLFVAACMAGSGPSSGMPPQPAETSLQEFVFTSLRHGTMQIYSMRGDGTAERRLTQTSSTAPDPDEQHRTAACLVPRRQQACLYFLPQWSGRYLCDERRR